MTASHSPSIIIVDDDVAIMECVGNALETTGLVRVLGYATHAQAGLVQAVERHLDVVAIDIHMPGADAF